MLTLTLTLTGLGVANYFVFSAKLSSTFVQEGARDARADARTLELAYASAGADERPFDEVREVVEYISNRPQVIAVALVDTRGVVVAADDPDAIGETEARRLVG